MAKPLMPYGSKRHSSLIVKEGEPSKIAEHPSSQLAAEATASLGGHLTMGGWVSKSPDLDGPVSRLVRRNAGKA